MGGERWGGARVKGGALRVAAVMIAQRAANVGQGEFGERRREEFAKFKSVFASLYLCICGRQLDLTNKLCAFNLDIFVIVNDVWD